MPILNQEEFTGDMPPKGTQTNPVLVVIFVVIAIILGGALAGAFLLKARQNNELERLDTRQAEIVNQASSIEDTIAEAQTLQSKLQMVKDMLDTHIHWTNFFAMIERSTLTDTYIEAVQLSDSTNKLGISGHTKSFDSVAEQVKAYETDKEIDEFDLESAKVNIGEDAGVYIVDFTGTLTYNEALIYNLNNTE
ncbi:MAG: hypothetical protein ABIE68_01000 [bacterium]